MASIIFSIFVVGLIVVKDAIGEVTSSDDGKSGTISFTPPTLNDEEAHSKWIPIELKCDACTVIAYKVIRNLQSFSEYVVLQCRT